MTTAIVTGASTGIGRAVALSIAGRDHNVVVNSLQDEAGGLATVNAIEQMGGTAVYCRADVSMEPGVDQVFDTCERTFGPADILVNNAGASRSAPFGTWTQAHWHDMLSNNLLTVALMSQAFPLRLPPPATGTIVNIASIRGHLESPRLGLAAYSAAKAGVLSLTRALARELAPRITINSVSPGFVETQYLHRADPGMVERWRSEVPLGRFIVPTEIAELVLMLLGQPAITGSDIVIDGGWTAPRE